MSSIAKDFAKGAIVTSRIGEYEVMAEPFMQTEMVVPVRPSEDRTLDAYGPAVQLMLVSALALVHRAGDE